MSYYLLNQSVVYDGLTGKLVSLRNGQHRQLRSNEWKLLQLFIDNAGRDITVQDILESIWQSKRAKSSAITAIKNLRHQLDDKVEAPTYIQTQVMSGYVFIATATTLTQAELNRVLAPHRSKLALISSWLYQVRWQVGCYLTNALSLAIIVASTLSLFRLGAFDQYITTRQSTRVIPMTISTTNGKAPSERDIRTCNSLLIDAQQTSRLYQLPVTWEPNHSYPTLTWSTDTRELLKCHLPSTSL
ncbi:winged helix-turn-helix domain-containing protein [Vibrio sp. WXL210]|uniref:winged helix-turn-helix domain-containing protein n=1 Tax=Vibrio sp. WXL210 TaxID=3450709 RepID=UPI003EC5DBA3